MKRALTKKLLLIIIVLVTSATCSEVNFVEPEVIEPEMVVTFLDVPLENYSFSPEDVIAVQPRAEITPPDVIEWCFFVNSEKIKCDIAPRNKTAGHRFYLNRHQEQNVVFWARSGSIEREISWFWEGK